MKVQDDISNEWTDKPKPIYSSNFFKVGSKSWEHNKKIFIAMQNGYTMGTLQQSFRPGNKASQEHIVW